MSPHDVMCRFVSVKQTLLGLSFWVYTLSFPWMLGWLGFIWGLLFVLFQNHRGTEAWEDVILIGGAVMLSCLFSLAAPSISSGLLFYTIRQQTGIQQVSSSDEEFRFSDHASLSRFNRAQFNLSMGGLLCWIFFILNLALSIGTEGLDFSNFAYALGLFSLMALIGQAVLFYMTWTKAVKYLDSLSARTTSVQGYNLL